MLITFIELSSRCNSNCKHCFRNKDRNYDMGYWAFRKILDSAKDLGYWNRVYLSGQGESLINPDFWRCLAYAKALGFRTQVSTNGKLINPDNIDIFTSLVDEIQISLDSLWNYELRDQEPSNILEKIELIHSRLRKENGFQVNILVSPDNINELPEIFEKLNCDFSVEILQLQHTKKHSLFKKEWEQNKNMLERRKEIYEIAKPHLKKIAYWEFGGSFYTCFSRKKNLGITSDEYIVPCLWRLDPEDFNLGKFDRPINEILYSKDYSDFRNDPEVYLDVCEPCMWVDEILGRDKKHKLEFSGVSI